MVLNVVRIARLVTPAMLRQGGGGIVNVSTFSAFEPSPAFPSPPPCAPPLQASRSSTPTATRPTASG